MGMPALPNPPAPAIRTEPPRSAFAIDVPASVLARARAGDRAAFEQIYRWFERPVFTLALRMLAGRHGDGRDAAHEVLQDTMLKVIDKVSEFRGTGASGASPFWGWLRQIAINEALMRLRRDRRLELEVGAGDEADALEDHAPLPPAAADAALLQRALAQLPPATRSVLWLYHAEGHTHEEIATLMGRTTSFSKSQLARGTRRLRSLLAPEPAPLRALDRPEVAHA
jgi:RNA polymerase sigma factor (sigma-70 family)